MSGPQFGSGRMLSIGGPFAPTVACEVEINTLPDYVWTFDTAFLGHLVQTTSADGTVDYQYDSRGQLLGADYTAGARTTDKNIHPTVSFRQTCVKS